jgi:RNA polymerase sigma factor (sigma-70 family)
MIRSVKNMAIDYLRKQKRDEMNIRKNIPIWDGEINQLFDVERIVVEGCVLSTVSDVLSSFPERKSRIFRENIIENKSHAEVSLNEGLSRYKIKKIETEIYQELKNKLKEYLK